MSENVNTPATAAPPPPSRANPRLWIAGILGVLVVGLLAWLVSPLSPWANRPSCCVPPSPTAVAVVTPVTPVAVVTPPTPFAGGATFTPEPRVVISGPHILGITAGVGQRAGEVAGLAPIAVTFSEAMDQPSAQAAFALHPAAPGQFKWMQNTLLFTPNAPLAPSTEYTIEMAAAAQTSAGKPLAAPLAARFTTAPPPVILRTLPTGGANEVPTDVIVTITFNRPMIPLTSLENQPDASQWITISPAVAGRWVWLGTAAAGFRADGAGFQPATQYTVDVKAGWPDATGVQLAQGTHVQFTTIKPAIETVSPSNGAVSVPLDTPLVVGFNMPMDHESVQRAFTPHVGARNSALPGQYAWSADSTVMTFTPASLLEFSTEYGVVIGGQVQAANGGAGELVGGAAGNAWTFRTTESTHVSGHNPDSDSNGLAPPSDGFSFYFNNPLLPGQQVASFLTINPTPEGYKGQLELDGTGVVTTGVRLLPNTTYTFALKEGLKDKWGFPVAPAQWSVKIGPLPPSLQVKGGLFQPVYADAPTRLQLETANVDKVTLYLYQWNENDLRAQFNPDNNPYSNPTPVYPGQLRRTWDVSVQGVPTSTTTIYPVIALDAQQDRLPPGFYYVRATATTPYDTQPLEGATVLVVGRTGIVTKSEDHDLLLWAADLRTGAPVANYPLRVEQWHNGQAVTTQRGRTDKDGVLRVTLEQRDNINAVVAMGEQSGDVAFVTTGWTNNLQPWNFGASGSYGADPIRAALYTDRPIYRPAQIVYFRGVARLDDDALYTLPKGNTISLFATTYGNNGETRVYTGTTTLSQAGTFNGQFTLPGDAPIGSYSLRAVLGNDVNSATLTSASFDVQEYRKPDFQVSVTAGRPAGVHGDPITATIATSYYFGGPLANITATVNLQSSPYYFSWSDPDTGESYQFGEGGYPYPYYTDYGSSPYATPQPVQSFQQRTGKDGLLTVDVSPYITTTGGSQSVLIEGQVQDLSNQSVANNTNLVVHQGLYYVGLHVADYIATAGQPTTITVRTVDSISEKVQPNVAVHLKFVREEWTGPRYGEQGTWQMTETVVGEQNLTTDGAGRASTLFTPPVAGTYKVIADSTDSRGNVVRSSTQFWVTGKDSGYVPWRYSNPQQVTLVADKTEYKLGDTAHILVTSPFTQAYALLTVERGHLRRYQVLQLTGGAPTVDVPLVDGDLPNVYVGLTLLGPEGLPPGAPASWGQRATLRQGYVNLALDTSSKHLTVSLEPAGIGPIAPGTTTTLTVRTRDSAGNPAPGELSLSVVDEAIYALQGDKSSDLFGTYWSQRGTAVQTGSSFTAGDNNYGYGERGGGYRYEDAVMAGAVPLPSAAAPPTGSAASEQRMVKSEPQKVRTDFRDTAYWTATITTGPDGSAQVPVPLPDNLTTWRLTAQGITANTLAGQGSTALTVTQALLLRPVQPRFLTTGDVVRPQAIIHNNTAAPLQVEASLVVSGAVTLGADPPAAQTLTVAPGEQAVVSWSVEVGKGDVANLRYWVHTVDATGTAYLEDAVAAHLPVKPFAAPEAVATSGQVDGTRADESIFLPYSINPQLGELVIQVSPSLAAATTDSLSYVAEYPYESTDQTISRFLPLVVLEKVYNEQGLSTPYAPDIPGIMTRALRRLGDLQQPDGGWAWWERGPSNWWETAYVVQGLTAARDAGYVIPGDLLQRGIQRLREFQGENGAQGLDETYHLNMRAYSLYVLGQAVGGQGDTALTDEGRDLVGQAPRLSVHARAWLALALDGLGMKAESKQVLDSLAAAARQSSTTAHWEEDRPDYWSMGTDTRATALAIDALVTLAPNDPLVPKAVRWLMTAQKEGHWLSSQETAISLISLAHYMRQSKELQADYQWEVSAFDKALGSGVGNVQTLTQTTTMRLPISEIPQNTLGDLTVRRDGTKGKLYYQMSLRYYVPGEGIKARSEGLAITRSYYRMSGGVASADPVTEVGAGDLLKIRLTIVAPETSYYVLVTDPLPAGLEGVNGSLNTTSFTERPPNPSGSIQQPTDGGGGPRYGMYYDWYYRWGPFDNVEMRDDRTVLFAGYMGPGTYVYEYYARATTPGTYMALPAHAELLYYPDVFGHSDGGAFTVK